MTRAGVTIGLSLLLIATAAAAQGTDTELARIDSLVTAGELSVARARLRAWRDAHPPGPGGPGRGTQAYALFLQGRLATDWTGAEDAYLRVVLGYPTSQQAPHALLLLGKGLLAAASIDAPSTAAIRAVSYLERLSNDYPGHPLHDEAQIWLARAHADAGNTRQGCAVLRQALDRRTQPARDDDMRTAWESMCSEAVVAAEPPVSAAPDSALRREQIPPPVVSQRDTVRTTEREDTRPPGSFTVQVAAMRSRDGARTIAGQLEALGFNPRVVDLRGSGLIRVRVDVFHTEREAESLAARIRQHGFEAIVASDVLRERRRP